MSQALDSFTSGTGPDTALLIHSSGMSAAQWLRHASILGRQHRVIAPQLLGYAKSPPWDPAKTEADGDDLAALQGFVETLDGPIHLVGHSYGGTLAARLALALPRRFSTLALFEPVLLGLLRASDDQQDRDALRDIGLRSLEGLTPGSAPWMERFVDYWSGEGTFVKMAPGFRDGFLKAGPKVAAEVIGISSDERPPEAYGALILPALCIYGETTTLAGKRMTERMASALPDAELKRIAGAGHMAVMTKAAEACALLEGLFARAATPSKLD